LVNSTLLKGKIISEGYTQEKLSRKLGISAQSLNYKIHNNREFKVSEIQKVCELLKIKDKDKYFFCN